MVPKILVGTIFSEVKDYVIRDWYGNVMKYTHPNFDFCAVDNSKDGEYHKKISDYFLEHKKDSNCGKVTVIHTPRTSQDSEVFMAVSANKLRDHFLEGGYTHLLYNECDVYSPPDIIERLLSHDKEIISALFFIGAKGTSYPMISTMHTYINKNPFMTTLGYIEGFYDIGEWHEPKPLINGGLGCTLISRDVLLRIPFQHDPNLEHHHDTIFARDVWESGIDNMYVPIMCRHENQPWTLQRKLIGKL